MWANILPQKLRKHRSVIYFMLVVFCAHFFWKFFIGGTDSDTIISLWGFDISKPFMFLAAHIADIVACGLQLLGFQIETFADNIIQHSNGAAVRIVWSCTGVKQAFIFTCLILFYPGNWAKKMWFVPVGLIMVYLVNVFRITAITALIKYFPNQFELLHEHIFKYLFYLALFGLWVLWDDKIAMQKPKNESADNNTNKC